MLFMLECSERVEALHVLISGDSGVLIENYNYGYLAMIELQSVHCYVLHVYV